MENTDSPTPAATDFDPVPQARLEFEADFVTCPVLALCGFSSVRSVEIRADQVLPRATLTVALEGYPLCTVHRAVGALAAGSRVGVDATSFRLPLDLLRGATERRHVDIQATLRSHDETVLARQSHRLAIQPESHWPGRHHACETIAAFATPNAESLADVLRDASRRLEQKTGSGALDGYLSGNAERVQRIAESCYEAVAALGLTYVVMQASFEEEGQKVRTFDDVLRDRMGNCLDLSVALAAVYEAAGLHPMIAIGDGHAIVAFFTTNDMFTDPMHEGVSRLATRIDLGEARVVEATMLCGAPAPFRNALGEGESWLSTASDGCCVVDIHACRLVGIHPWPEAVVRDAAHPEGMVEAPPASYRIVQPSDLPPLPKPVLAPRAARLETWKARLLDLTLRNRLLNDSGASGIPLVPAGDSALEALLSALLSERSLSLRPVATTAGMVLESAMREELESGILRTEMDPEELFQRATKAYRDARSSLEETGARSLHVAVGTLEFTVEHRPYPVRAPLLLVPATLERVSRSEGFRVRMVPDEIVPNVALIEYLRVTQGKDPALSAEPLAEGGAAAIAEVLDHVRRAVRDVPGARVLPIAKLGNYSFKKLPLFEELRQRSDALTAHPVVAALLDRDAEPGLRRAALVDPAVAGRDARYGALSLPLPADSSQVAAVLSATAGNTFVLQGPPGTGKSQTITNLLVESMAQGLRVLFVAEKGAALEVVLERLRRTGLGPFALDLHADNATKTHFTSQVKAVLDVLDDTGSTAPLRHGESSAELDRIAQRMRRAMEALHQSPDGGMAVFQAIDRACALAEATPAARDHVALSGRLDGALGPDADALRIEETVAAVERLTATFTALPPGTSTHLAGWDPDRSVSPETAADLVRAAAAALGSLAAWRSAGARLADAFEIAAPVSVGDADALARVAEAIDTTHPASSWLAAQALHPDHARLLGECAEALRLDEAACGAIQSVESRHDRAVLDETLPEWAGDLRAAREKMFLARWLAVRAVRGRLVRHAKGTPPKDLAGLLDEIERLMAEKAAIAAAEPGNEIVARFRHAGRPVDHAAGHAAVERALSLADAARRHLPAALGVLAHRVPAAISDGTAAPILAASMETGAQWLAAVASLADAAPSPSLERETWSLEAVRELLEGLAAHGRLLPAWSAFTTARHRAVLAGVGAVADALLSGALDPGTAAAAAEAEMVVSWVRRRLRDDPALADCASERMDAMRASFRSGIERHARAVPAVVAERVRTAARARLEDLSVPGMRAAANQLNQLRAISTIRRPIRRVLSEAAPAIAAIQPVVLASPLTASTLLPPDFPAFDLVVFDEASQVPVWDAACAIARGKSCVIVGDSRQLPPTRFFERREGAGDDGGMADEARGDDGFEPLESVLDEAIASGIPQQSLLWHYRSKDERLIEFSNRRSYGAQLKTFPAACRTHPNLGVEFRHVAGTYARGTRNTNRREAEAVVDEIRRRMLDPDACPANRSIGVVTFSVAQQTLVQDLLDEALDTDPRFRERVAQSREAGEDLFVKNLENVQGDERATMLFSICYGPDPTGRVHHNFGPLNLAGGERRLNVAVSRAREKVVVITSIRATDLDPKRCTAQGVRDLRDYLAFAEHGVVPSMREDAVRPDAFDVSAVEQRLARRLEAEGFRVDVHVGRSRDYRVSLALALPSDPDTWVLGVEIDGAFQLAAPAVADREVVRPGVLRALGWRTLATSVVDVVRDEDAVVRRIVDAARAPA